MLNCYYSIGFHEIQDFLSHKIARKITTIFSNRYHFIEKLTPAKKKNWVQRC